MQTLSIFLHNVGHLIVSWRVA